MPEFIDKTSNWLARPKGSRGISMCDSLPIVVATDVGLKRADNQDRVVTIRIGSRASGGRPLIATVVSDGMGGMSEGAKAAEVTIAAFCFGLLQNRFRDLQERVAAAMVDANSRVFSLLNGNGGATLSAVVMDADGRTLVANLGDSRVYAYSGKSDRSERLTVDDSIEEAVGGRGRDLLQFVGMGEGIQPQLKEVPPHVERLAITTDGIHYIDNGTLDAIIRMSPSLEEASRRLVEIALWCGGHDNASIALMQLTILRSEIAADDSEGVQLWDPFGSLTAMWIREEHYFEKPRVQFQRGDHNNHIERAEGNVGIRSDAPANSSSPKQRKPQANRKKRNEDKVQLKIELGDTEGQGDDS
jgi:serine/threonine protein phosphatase PrpC